MLVSGMCTHSSSIQDSSIILRLIISDIYFKQHFSSWRELYSFRIFSFRLIDFIYCLPRNKTVSICRQRPVGPVNSTETYKLVMQVDIANIVCAHSKHLSNELRSKRSLVQSMKLIYIYIYIYIYI